MARSMVTMAQRMSFSHVPARRQKPVVSQRPICFLAPGLVHPAKPTQFQTGIAKPTIHSVGRCLALPCPLLERAVHLSNLRPQTTRPAAHCVAWVLRSGKLEHKYRTTRFVCGCAQSKSVCAHIWYCLRSSLLCRFAHTLGTRGHFKASPEAGQRVTAEARPAAHGLLEPLHSDDWPVFLAASTRGRWGCLWAARTSYKSCSPAKAPGAQG